MTKVSIIVPVYNTSKYLKNCLDSLVNQTLKDIEIITIDDCSTDNSLDILNEYKDKYNIKVIHNNKNKGPGICRNIGLDIATGEYIGFVDSDDYVKNNMFYRMYNAAINNNHADLITCNISFVKPNSKYDNKNEEDSYSYAREIDYKKSPIDIIWDSPSCCNKLFKRDLIGSYRFLENCMWEDYAFTYTMIMKAKKTIYINNSFYLYRKDISEGISRKGYNIDAPIDDIFKVADELEKGAIKNRVYRKFKDAIKYLQIIACLQRLNEIDEWDVEKKFKDKYKEYLYKKARTRYGSFKTLDTSLLSGRINLELVKDIEYSINEKTNRSKYRL